MVQFLTNYCENDHLAIIIKNFKKIHGRRTTSYTIHQNCVIKTTGNNYECYHEKADTRILVDAYKAAPGSRMLLKSVDTDVLIVLFGNMHKILDCEIWLARSRTKKRVLITSILSIARN